MSKRKPTIGNSIHDLKPYIENVPTILNSKKLSVYLTAAEKLLSAGETCHKKRDYENEYIFKMRYVVFVMKLMKEHKGFSEESMKSMKNEYRSKCKSIIEELEELKVILKEIYDQNRNETTECADMEVKEEEESKDLHNDRNKINENEIKEEEDTLASNLEETSNNIEMGKIENKNNYIESISDTNFKNEIQKYFVDERHDIYHRMVYESNKFQTEQKQESHDSDTIDLSSNSFEISKDLNTHSDFKLDDKKDEYLFPSFTQTIRGSQFNPDYIRPENLMTYGPTCTHKPTKALNPTPISHQPHIHLPNHNVYDKQTQESQNFPIPPIVNVSPTSFPILTNQKPIISSNETVAKLTRIEIDGEILDAFMRHAYQNSRNNIETCGNLAGKLDKERNVFTLTHVLIPKQKGTSDTCITSNEEDIVEYQIKNELITLGWIHTHPSQACFLSSVDLHTHYSYQRLFKEAIAIVIAPKDNPNFSIFRLSDYGLEVIGKCTFNGFHYHEERGLYETCRHVFLRWNVKKFKMVDFRYN